MDEAQNDTTMQNGAAAPAVEETSAPMDASMPEDANVGGMVDLDKEMGEGSTEETPVAPAEESPAM